MLIILLITVTLLALWRRQRRGVVTAEDRLLFNFSSPLMIICGDCAGDGIVPRKTFRDRFGRCATCSGSSWTPAGSCGHQRQTFNNLSDQRLEA